MAIDLNLTVYLCGWAGTGAIVGAILGNKRGLCIGIVVGLIVSMLMGYLETLLWFLITDLPPHPSPELW